MIKHRHCADKAPHGFDLAQSGALRFDGGS